VILGSVYFGRQNLDNLQAAFAARRLIVVEDLPIAARDCTDGEAMQLYQELIRKKQPRIISKTVVLQELTAGRLFRHGVDKTAMKNTKQTNST
jgi:iron complex transport system ATP-binding protein